MQCEKHTKIIIMPYNVKLSNIISLSVKFWTSLVTGIRASAMEIGSIRLYQNNNCTLYIIYHKSAVLENMHWFWTNFFKWSKNIYIAASYFLSNQKCGLSAILKWTLSALRQAIYIYFRLRFTLRNSNYTYLRF